MYGDYEDYDELMDDYNGQLDELADQERDTCDMYEAEIREIDEYWDREDEYIEKAQKTVGSSRHLYAVISNNKEMKKSHECDSFKMEQCRSSLAPSRETYPDSQNFRSDAAKISTISDSSKLFPEKLVIFVVFLYL